MYLFIYFFEDMLVTIYFLEIKMSGEKRWKSNSLIQKVHISQ